MRRPALPDHDQSDQTSPTTTSPQALLAGCRHGASRGGWIRSCRGTARVVTHVCSIHSRLDESDERARRHLARSSRCRRGPGSSGACAPSGRRLRASSGSSCRPEQPREDPRQGGEGNPQRCTLQGGGDRGIVVQLDREQRLCQRQALQRDADAVTGEVDHEVDAASASPDLRVRLWQRREAVAELVVTSAVDGLGVTTLASREPLGHEDRIECGAHRQCEVQVHVSDDRRIQPAVPGSCSCADQREVLAVRPFVTPTNAWVTSSSRSMRHTRAIVVGSRSVTTRVTTSLRW